MRYSRGLRRPRDVSTLAANQARLLQAAARLLKPGGRLVYAVCSLQPEEGEARIEGTGLRPDPIRPAELPGLPDAITPDGRLRTHPGLWPERGGLDGFLASRFRKEA